MRISPFTGETTTGHFLRNLDGSTGRVLTFSPDSKYLAAQTSDPTPTVAVWNLATGDPIGEPISHPGDVTFAQFADRGNRVLLATSQYGAVRFVRAWELRRPVEPL